MPVRCGWSGTPGNNSASWNYTKHWPWPKNATWTWWKWPPEGVPPVCRILNYGKFKYAQRKKEKEAAKKQHIIRVKELKIRPKIDEHDYQTKLRMAWGFFEHGDKVKCTLMFRAVS